MSAPSDSPHPVLSLGEVCRQGALEALRNGARKARNGKREEWLVSEVSRLRAVVTELIAENLTLKGGAWFEAAPALF